MDPHDDEEQQPSPLHELEEGGGAASGHDSRKSVHDLKGILAAQVEASAASESRRTARKEAIESKHEDILAKLEAKRKQRRVPGRKAGAGRPNTQQWRMSILEANRLLEEQKRASRQTKREETKRDIADRAERLREKGRNGEGAPVIEALDVNVDDDDDVDIPPPPSLPPIVIPNILSEHSLRGLSHEPL